MKKKVCLEKGQLQNIVSAARGEPGACEKAAEFIEQDLGMPDKKKKGKKGKGVEERITGFVDRKITSKISRFLDGFF